MQGDGFYKKSHVYIRQALKISARISLTVANFMVGLMRSLTS